MFYRWVTIEFDQLLEGVETEENAQAFQISGTLVKGDYPDAATEIAFKPGEVFVAPKVEIVPKVRMW